MDAGDPLVGMAINTALQAADAEEPQRQAEARRSQAALLRDLFGLLPFREVHTDPAWLTWNGSTVRRLAEEVYQERVMPAGTLDPHRLTVLADAILDAGCTDADILGHLRGPGPHWRGCHMLDILLGKA